MKVKQNEFELTKNEFIKKILVNNFNTQQTLIVQSVHSLSIVLWLFL